MTIKVLDLRGLKCPLPVLKTRKAMKELVSGTQIWVETTDPLSVIDMPNYCQESGHRLLETTKDDDMLRFLIEKA